MIEIARGLKNGERYALQQIRYDKTYQKDLPQVPPMDIDAVARQIRTERPDLLIEIRS
jgi:hypothetical protein